MDASQVSEAEVSRASKGQAPAAGGLRLLTEPLCFVSSLLVKKPSRLHGLWMVMTGAVLVSAGAPRRRRQPWVRPHQPWVRPHQTVPHHMPPPTQRPPWRGVCQRLAGMHRVRVTRQGHVPDLLEGLNAVQLTILRLCGEGGCRLYQISPG